MGAAASEGESVSENKETRPPLFILARGEMSKGDIAKLNEFGFLTVEAKDPSKIRFAEPPPGDYTEMEKASIRLTRWIMGNNSNATFYKSTIVEKFVQILLEGSPLAPVPQPEPPKKVPK